MDKAVKDVKTAVSDYNDKALALTTLCCTECGAAQVDGEYTKYVKIAAAVFYSVFCANLLLASRIRLCPAVGMATKSVPLRNILPTTVQQR